MSNNRRRFLAVRASGLATLLVPDLTLGGLGHRRRQVRCQTVINPAPSQAVVSQYPPTFAVTPLHPCPVRFQWYSTMSPAIPDATKMKASASHTSTVYGTGLALWVYNGGTFPPSISDDKNPSGVKWGGYSNAFVTYNPNATGTPNNPESYTFSASETGSSAGSSTITISPLPSTSRTGGSQSQQQVTCQ